MKRFARLAGPVVLAGLITGLLIAPAARLALAQELPQIVRFTLAGEGGAGPIGETTIFRATDRQAVAWVQFTPSPIEHSIEFRWSDPSGTRQRTTVRVLAVGQEVLFDELPIRDQPPSTLRGIWTVQLLGNGFLLSTLTFTILPREAVRPFQIQYESQFSLQGSSKSTGTKPFEQSVLLVENQVIRVTYRPSPERTTTLQMLAGRGWGSRDQLDHYSLSLAQSGKSMAWSVLGDFNRLYDLTQSPGVATNVRYAYADLTLYYPRWPFVYVYWDMTDEADDLASHLTDDKTTTFSGNLSHSIGRWAYSANYYAQQFVDRTGFSQNFDIHSLSATVVYTISPQFSLSVSRGGEVSDYAATVFATAFHGTSESTTLRLAYVANRRLTLGATYTSEAVDEAGTVSRLTSGVLDARYRLSPAVTLRGGVGTHEAVATSAGAVSVTPGVLYIVGLDYRAPNRTFTITYQPLIQSPSTGQPVTRTDLTATFSYFPGAFLSINASYKLDESVTAPSRKESAELKVRYRTSQSVTVELSGKYSRNINALVPSSDSTEFSYSVLTRVRW